ncbi:hypothetical protein GPECTOR_87g411 [Gonium pectorale]|uniref:Uncharacterized protein n=1 Tax=Gonium pectorale TaxID=33097 RepID=A0A150G118_GONPE|nr:hypothetical protein GPECTOR_87g411 [Gonium pectorale]|eukprot:KXZ43549.1 hypothetical protein GPECTOR_87g411 [Gonium pectorale]
MGVTHWQAWLRRAFLALPERTGTLHDLAAVLETDPEIAPKLDNRYPEFLDTGVKRGKLKVYRYDEHVAAQAPGQRSRKGRA